ncbi:hypothetical protein GCM10027321_36090 [Massilia terrae]|uniref:Transmembrane protein n=1 Tax=Massilia terrae TaxID=1811224 RepID=A0ABT2D482_9BURK|nr:hypothetical protein [Massilia terrae]MCS0661047.1 hypothetical protein [Massilia terrae]
MPIIDRILPDLLRVDRGQWQAARHLSILAAVTAASIPLLVLMYHLLGYDAVGMVVLTAGIVMMVTPFTLNAGVPLAVARDLFVGALFLLKVWMAVHLGGVAAPTTAWFVLCPAVAMLIGGFRPGLVWAAIVTGTMVLLFGLERAGLILPPQATPGMPLLQLVSMLGLAGLVTLIMALAKGAGSIERRGH